MIQNDFLDRNFSEGFHGTDENTAFEVVKNGFRTDTWDDLCFSAPDEEWLAHGHGQKNAARAGRNRYAILRAAFPQTPSREGIAGPACIRLYGDDIAKVSVIGMAIYRATDRELVQTYDEVALEAVRQSYQG